MTRWEDLRWAWWAHRRVPYRFREIWSARGRQEHYRRLVTYLTTPMAKEVRVDLARRGLRAPDAWTDVDLAKLHEVLVGRCYEVDGFTPPPNGLTVDAGCGFGDFALLAATRGRVVAFDPNPENVRRTCELLEVNHFQDRITVEAVALGRQNGTIALGRSGEVMLARDSRRAPQEHAMRSLDSILFEAPVTLFKVDVEGMEADVLQGAATTLRRDRPRVIVEVHGPRASREVHDILTAMGYDLAFTGSRREERPFGIVSNEFWRPGGTGR